MERLLDYLQHHPILVGAVVVVAIAALVVELRARGQGGGSAVSPQEAIRLMNQGATVFDVRAPEAYAEGHIAGAKPLTSEQLDDAANALKKHREKLVIVVCERGVSANAAVRKLQAAGFTKVFNLAGGLTAWRADNLPLVRT